MLLAGCGSCLPFLIPSTVTGSAAVKRADAWCGPQTSSPSTSPETRYTLAMLFFPECHSFSVSALLHMLFSQASHLFASRPSVCHCWSVRHYQTVFPSGLALGLSCGSPCPQGFTQMPGTQQLLREHCRLNAIVTISCICRALFQFRKPFLWQLCHLIFTEHLSFKGGRGPTGVSVSKEETEAGRLEVCCPGGQWTGALPTLSCLKQAWKCNIFGPGCNIVCS